VPTSRLGLRGGRGGTAKAPLTGSAYDQVVQGDGPLYYFPLGAVPTTELMGGKNLTLQSNSSNPVPKPGALPNADTAQSLIGTNSVAGSSGYWSRAGEATMTIQAGMVLEAVVKRISGTYGPVYPFSINYGSWTWWFEIDGANWTTVVWAPGGQKTFWQNSAPTPLALTTWYHVAMRVQTANNFAFNAPAVYLNGVLQAGTETDQGGMGTPSGSVLQVGSLANGDTGIENYVAKVAVYASLTDARILAHAQAMGLA
jgi:hypothetical protein